MGKVPSDDDDLSPSYLEYPLRSDDGVCQEPKTYTHHGVPGPFSMPGE